MLPNRQQPVHCLAAFQTGNRRCGWSTPLCGEQIVVFISEEQSRKLVASVSGDRLDHPHDGIPRSKIGLADFGRHARAVVGTPEEAAQYFGDAEVQPGLRRQAGEPPVI